VESQLATLPRAEIARASWNDFGAIILVKTLDEAVELANAIAAEHLEIMTADAEGLSAKVRNAGRDLSAAYAGGDRRLCRRLQPCTADGAFGPVLAGLGVLDFMKRTRSQCGPSNCARWGPPR